MRDRPASRARRLRAPFALGLAAVALLGAGGDVAAEATPGNMPCIPEGFCRTPKPKPAGSGGPATVPCTPAGRGHYNCRFRVAGNGRTGGSPVQASDGHRVGWLHRGTNWVECMRVGGSVRSGRSFNDTWAWTVADNNKAGGWVNAVYASGGANDGRFGGGVPWCADQHGTPPGNASGSQPAPAPPPGGGSQAPVPLPPPVQTPERDCISPTFTYYPGENLLNRRVGRAEATFAFCPGQHGKDIKTIPFAGTNSTGDQLGVTITNARIVPVTINPGGGVFELRFRSSQCLGLASIPQICQGSGDFTVRYTISTLRQTGPATTVPEARIQETWRSAPSGSALFDTE